CPRNILSFLPKTPYDNQGHEFQEDLISVLLFTILLKHNEGERFPGTGQTPCFLGIAGQNPGHGSSEGKKARPSQRFLLQGGSAMLVLSRKLGEEIVIGENIRLTVVAVHGN